MVVGEDVLVDLRPVDVDVDDFGVGAKVAGSVATRSEKRQPTAMSRSHWSDGEVGGVGAVHTDHAGEQGVVAGAGAAAHDGGGHRGVQRLDKFAELGHSALGADHAAAHQHQGLLGLLNQIQQLV